MKRVALKITADMLQKIETIEKNHGFKSVRAQKAGFHR